MGIENDDLDPIAALLESGTLDENASVTDIAAMLEAQGGTPARQQSTDADAEAAKAADAAAKEGESGTKTDEAAAGTQATAQVAATDVKTTAENSSARDQQSTEVEGPIAGKNGGTIPYGVLDGTRKSLTQARRRLEEVEQQREQERAEREKVERELADARAQLQSHKTATAQATTAVQQAAEAAGVKGDVRSVDIAKLRDNFPAEVVDAIEALQAQNANLQREVSKLHKRDEGRQQSDEEVVAQRVQDDIDAVPKLSEWQAENKHMWIAAKAVDDSLRADPAWSGKPRVERFQEVVRQLGGPAPQSPQGSTPTQQPAAAGTKLKVDDALAQAERFAVPLSHSGLPAGSPPAQSEAQGLENMDVTQIADKFSEMTDGQLEKLLARIPG